MAVLFPEVREPYRNVLEEIVTGVEQATDWKVRRFEIPDPVSEEVMASLESVPACRSVIGLGRAGLQAAQPFAGQLPVVAGAVLVQPGQATDIPTFSFVPSPEELFVRLKHFLPKVRRVTVIFDPENSGELVRRAGRSATDMGIELVALEVQNLQDAAVRYKKVLATSKSDSDAIWLVRDAASIDTGAVLTLVLEQAWKRKLVVFSDQLTHVKYGVLFSVYPDNRRLGERLGAFAEQCAVDGCESKGVMLLHDLDTAVNIRTAQRLGIIIDRRNDPYADLVLPAN
jgi:putative ABC transport system substrate-binding protein